MCWIFTYACVFSYIRRGAKPIAVLQSVAAGALGPKAQEGGIKTAALGLFFHFLIALTAATVYYFSSRVLGFMITHAIISGILYGICVYLFMYGIVLRVSAIHSTRYPWPVLIGNLAIHTLGIGLTIALITRILFSQINGLKPLLVRPTYAVSIFPKART